MRKYQDYMDSMSLDKGLRDNIVKQAAQGRKPSTGRPRIRRYGGIAASIAVVLLSIWGISELLNNPNIVQDPLAPEVPEVLEPEPDPELDVKAQMAGNWIWYEFNPANALLVNLSADGSWESPGPWAGDMTTGGSFVIAREEAGIYRLRLTIEYTCGHPAAAHVELGSEWAWPYQYDTVNDRLGMEIPAEGYSGEMRMVWFTRVAEDEVAQGVNIAQTLQREFEASWCGF